MRLSGRRSAVSRKACPRERLAYRRSQAVESSPHSRSLLSDGIGIFATLLDLVSKYGYQGYTLCLSNKWLPRTSSVSALN